MKGITIKLPEEVLAKLRREARERGCSVAALIREKLEMPAAGESAYDLIADLIGSIKGGRRFSATNDRPKFRRPGETWAAARRRGAAWDAAQKNAAKSSTRGRR